MAQIKYYHDEEIFLEDVTPMSNLQLPALMDWLKLIKGIKATRNKSRVRIDGDNLTSLRIAYASVQLFFRS